MFARRLVALLPAMARMRQPRTFCVKNDSTAPLTMKGVKEAIVKAMGIDHTYNPKLSNREYLLQYEPKPSDLPPRSMQDSFTSAIIPLSTSHSLRDRYVTTLGYVRMGRLMEDMDKFAVWVVHKHLKVLNATPEVPLPFTFVTILVDKISFTDFHPKPDSDIRLSGHASWVGKSSVEVVVWLEQMSEGKWTKITRALFLMASRNATNTKSLMVNPLVPVTEQEKLIFAGGEARKQSRINRQKYSIFGNEPNPDELKIIHEIFVNSIDLSNMAFNQRVLTSESMWMEDATVTNLIFSHPEDRNAHNTVFGGFLMRHALELSYALAHRICPQRPELLHISDISFNRSVAVSSFIEMNAHVIYTEKNYLQIVVMAKIMEPKTKKYITSNVFYYTYSNADQVPSVMPRTYHEAMWYLDGRRRFLNAMDLDDSPEAPINTIEPTAK